MTEKDESEVRRKEKFLDRKARDFSSLSTRTPTLKSVSNETSFFISLPVFAVSFAPYFNTLLRDFKNAEINKFMMMPVNECALLRLCVWQQGAERKKKREQMKKKYINYVNEKFSRQRLTVKSMKCREKKKIKSSQSLAVKRGLRWQRAFQSLRNQAAMVRQRRSLSKSNAFDEK